MLTYYALVVAISWGGILVLVGPGGFPATKEESETLFPLVLLALFAGPSVGIGRRRLPQRSLFQCRGRRTLREGNIRLRKEPLRSSPSVTGGVTLVSSQ